MLNCFYRFILTPLSINSNLFSQKNIGMGLSCGGTRCVFKHPLCVYRKTFFPNHADADLHVTHSHLVVKRKFYLKNLRLNKNAGKFPFLPTKCHNIKLFGNNLLTREIREFPSNRNQFLWLAGHYNSTGETHNYSTINIKIVHNF